MEALRWVGTRGGLCLGNALRLSFQRYRAAGRITVAPPSLGALPVAPDPDEDGLFLVPLRRNEAAWIGLLREAEAETVVLKGVGILRGAAFDLAGGRRAHLSQAEPLPAKRFHIVPGLAQPGEAALPFAPAGRSRAQCGSLLFSARIASDAEERLARVELVSAARFAARTGQAAPPPAGLDSGYQGWLLP